MKIFLKRASRKTTKDKRDTPLQHDSLLKVIRTIQIDRSKQMLEHSLYNQNNKAEKYHGAKHQSFLANLFLVKIQDFRSLKHGKTSSRFWALFLLSRDSAHFATSRIYSDNNDYQIYVKHGETHKKKIATVRLFVFASFGKRVNRIGQIANVEVWPRKFSSIEFSSPQDSTV